MDTQARGQSANGRTTRIALLRARNTVDANDKKICAVKDFQAEGVFLRQAGCPMSGRGCLTNHTKEFT